MSHADLTPPLKLDSPATWTRYRVLAVCVIMAVLLYLDRFAINAVQPVVMEELGISKTGMGWITAAFFYCYALAQVPAGMLGDYIGGRRALAIFVASWSLVFGLQALALNFETFIFLRSVQGIAQAGAYAVTAGFLKYWIEDSWRGVANSAVSMGGRAGGLLNNLFTARLMMGLIPWMAWMGYASIYEPGRWREMFLIYGALGLVWAWSFYRWFRDTPGEHPSVNAAELAIIKSGQATKLSASPPLRPWAVFGNRNLWLLSAIMFFVNVGWIFLTTWQPSYLNEVYEWSLVKAGSYTAVTAVCGMAGCIAGGFATDFLVRRIGERWGRVLPGVISCGGAAGMYVLSQFVGESVWQVPLPGGTWHIEPADRVVAAFASVYFLNDFQLGALWSAVQDVGRKSSGAMFGFINMSGNLGAAAFPPIIGSLAEGKNWPAVFIASAGAFVLALTLWFFVDPRLKVVDE